MMCSPGRDDVFSRYLSFGSLVRCILLAGALGPNVKRSTNADQRVTLGADVDWRIGRSELAASLWLFVNLLNLRFIWSRCSFLPRDLIPAELLSVESALAAT